MQSGTDHDRIFAYYSSKYKRDADRSLARYKDAIKLLQYYNDVYKTELTIATAQEKQLLGPAKDLDAQLVHLLDREERLTRAVEAKAMEYARIIADIKGVKELVLLKKNDANNAEQPKVNYQKYYRLIRSQQHMVEVLMKSLSQEIGLSKSLLAEFANKQTERSAADARLLPREMQAAGSKLKVDYQRRYTLSWRRRRDYLMEQINELYREALRDKLEFDHRMSEAREGLVRERHAEAVRVPKTVTDQASPDRSSATSTSFAPSEPDSAYAPSSTPIEPATEGCKTLGDIGSMTIEQEFAMKEEVKFLAREQVRLKDEAESLKQKIHQSRDTLKTCLYELGHSTIDAAARAFNRAEADYGRVVEVMTRTGHECQQLERANASLRTRLRQRERDYRLAEQSVSTVAGRRLRKAYTKLQAMEAKHRDIMTDKREIDGVLSALQDYMDGSLIATVSMKDKLNRVDAYLRSFSQLMDAVERGAPLPSPAHRPESVQWAAAVPTPGAADSGAAGEDAAYHESVVPKELAGFQPTVSYPEAMEIRPAFDPNDPFGPMRAASTSLPYQQSASDAALTGNVALVGPDPLESDGGQSTVSNAGPSQSASALPGDKPDSLESDGASSMIEVSAQPRPKTPSVTVGSGKPHVLLQPGRMGIRVDINRVEKRYFASEPTSSDGRLATRPLTRVELDGDTMRKLLAALPSISRPGGGNPSIDPATLPTMAPSGRNSISSSVQPGQSWSPSADGPIPHGHRSLQPLPDLVEVTEEAAGWQLASKHGNHERNAGLASDQGRHFGHSVPEIDGAMVPQEQARQAQVPPVSMSPSPSWPTMQSTGSMPFNLPSTVPDHAVDPGDSESESYASYYSSKPNTARSGRAANRLTQQGRDSLRHASYGYAGSRSADLGGLGPSSSRSRPGAPVSYGTSGAGARSGASRPEGPEAGGFHGLAGNSIISGSEGYTEVSSDGGYSDDEFD